MRQCLTLWATWLAFNLSVQRSAQYSILFSDDHAVKAISEYGGPLEKVAPTPNIDRLAKKVAVF